jgi:hypothetical protein
VQNYTFLFKHGLFRVVLGVFQELFPAIRSNLSLFKEKSERISTAIGAKKNPPGKDQTEIFIHLFNF